MAAVVQRQPFGELGPARLRNLISAKNCQNAVSDKLSSSSKEKSYLKPSNTFSKPPVTFNAPTKRSYEPTVFEDDSDPDTENIDPSVFTPKRSKCNDGNATKPAVSQFVLKTETSIYKASSTGLSNSVGGKVTPPAYQFPGGASTAPAGRSPKQKRIGLLSPKRPSQSALYTRINPPSFGGSKSSGMGLPFSLDEAIRGTIAANHSKPGRQINAGKSKQPKEWFFNIYEDTPDEVSATVMEHSTGLLDLSSDDEAVALARKTDGRDKENIPPPDHVPMMDAGNAPHAEQSLGGKRRRRRGPKGVDDMAVDCEPRVALGVLRVEDFYGEGLDATSVIHVPDDDAPPASNVPAIEVTDEDKTVGTKVDNVPKTQGFNDPGFLIAEDSSDL